MQSCRSSKTKVWRSTCRTHCRMSAETPVLPVTAMNYGATPTHCCCSGRRTGVGGAVCQVLLWLWQLAPEKLMVSMIFLKTLPLFVCSGWGLAQLARLLVTYLMSLQCFSFPKGGWLCKAPKTRALSLQVRSREQMLHPGSQNPHAWCTTQDFRIYSAKTMPKGCNEVYEFWLMPEVVLFFF